VVAVVRQESLEAVTQCVVQHPNQRVNALVVFWSWGLRTHSNQPVELGEPAHRLQTAPTAFGAYGVTPFRGFGKVLVGNAASAISFRIQRGFGARLTR